MNGNRGLILATIAAFTFGCSVGLVGGILFVHLVVPRANAHFRPGPPPFMSRHGAGLRPGPGGPERWLPRIERALDMTPEQHERVMQLLDRAREDQAAVHESLHVQMVRVLTPRQRARWEEMEKGFMRSRGARGWRDSGPRDHP